jgi:polyhydroxyalkanoate synthesis repressor PhaR
MEENTRVIKRYANRKLYDTGSHRYVNLAELGELMAVTNNVKVIDNKTKNDITYHTQIQILFDAEKRATKNPTTVNKVVKSGQSLTEYIRGLEESTTQLVVSNG